MRTILTAAAVLVTTAGFALADAHQGNSSAATNMADTLKGTPGIGGAAPTVSGRNAKGDSGWGNAGSRVVAGEQVSRVKN